MALIIKANRFTLKIFGQANDDITALLNDVTRDMFKTQYSNVFDGDEQWKAIATENTETYQWQPESTYVRNPPYFEGMQAEPN